jgi:hypothetical protein
LTVIARAWFCTPYARMGMASPLCAWRTRDVLNADVNMPWSRRSSRALGRARLCTPGVS